VRAAVRYARVVNDPVLYTKAEHIIADTDACPPKVADVRSMPDVFTSDR
jgi:hypothetical protein